MKYAIRTFIEGSPEKNAESYLALVQMACSIMVYRRIILGRLEIYIVRYSKRQMASFA